MNYSLLNLRKLSFVFGLALLLLILLAASLPFFTQAQERAPTQRRTPTQRKLRTHENAIPNRYLVVLRDEATRYTTPERAVAEIGEAFATQFGARIERSFRHALHGYLMDMTKEQAEALSQDERVAYVEEDAEVRLAPIAARPQMESVQSGATWGLDRIDQRHLPLNQTYEANATGRGVNVYVIDSGIRWTHQEFQGRVVAAYDAVNDGYNTNDCTGHGTHVAGTIGGATYGVAKAVRLYSVRVLDCSGHGNWSQVIAGVDWVTANHSKPAVANVSINGLQFQAMDDAVKRSIAAGVTYVVSAGNNNRDACVESPARAEGTITVGATTDNDSRSSVSNFGTCVNLFAPGFAVTSAGITNDYSNAVMSGTSMAAPHVTGAAALFLENNPSATPATVASALIANGTSGQLTNVGAGSPNLLLFSQFNAGSGSACPNCKHYTGLLVGNDKVAFEPNGGFFQSNGIGSINGSLRGPAGADFDLYLWWWDGTQWLVVAKAESDTPNEDISYFGVPGYYTWRIYAFSGTGFYDFYANNP